MKKNTRRLALLSCLTASALLLAWLEFLLPLPIPLPGVKLGLANLAAVYALYRLGAREALLVSLARILLTAFLFGSLFSALYALAGALCALGVMALLRRAGPFSVYGVSMGGGAAHNAAQVAVAALVAHTEALFSYLPALLICGLATGFVVGLLADRLLLLPAIRT